MLSRKYRVKLHKRSRMRNDANQVTGPLMVCVDSISLLPFFLIEKNFGSTHSLALRMAGVSIPGESA